MDSTDSTGGQRKETYTLYFPEPLLEAAMSISTFRFSFTRSIQSTDLRKKLPNIRH